MATNTTQHVGVSGAMVNIVGEINEVNQHRARLVLGWVNYLGM